MTLSVQKALLSGYEPPKVPNPRGTTMRYTKNECMAKGINSFLTLKFPHAGGEYRYGHVGGGEDKHFYCAELNQVKVLRLEKRADETGGIPKPEDWIPVETYSPA